MIKLLLKILPTLGTPKSGLAIPARQRVTRALTVMLSTYLLVNLAIYIMVERDVLPLKDPLFHNQAKYFRQHGAFFGPCDKPRVLAMGSSRTQLAFDPFTFMKVHDCEAYNFGTPAAGSMTNAIYLRRLFAQGLQVDLVFIEWHPGFTAKPTDGRALEDNWLFDNRLNPEEYAYLNAWGNPRPQPPMNDWRNFWRSVLRYRVELVHRYFPKLEVIANVMNTIDVSFPRGYYAGLPYKAEDYDAGIRTTQRTYGSVFGNYHFGGPGVEAIKDMVKLVREHGAVPVVVVTAEAPEVQALYGDAANAELSSAFSNTFDCQVVVGRDWLKKEHTVDGHHATKEGSVIFTQQLATMVRPVKKP